MSEQTALLMLSQQLTRLADAISRGEDIRHADYEALANEVGELRGMVARILAGSDGSSIALLKNGDVTVKMNNKTVSWLKGHAATATLVLAGAMAGHFPHVASWLLKLLGGK